jgi:hypothetical protein
MKNVILPLAVILVGAPLVASACSSSHSGAPPGPDLQACALVASCGGPGFLAFGTTCEFLTLLQALPAQDFGSAAQLEAAALPCLQAAKSCADLKACSEATSAQAAVCGGKTDGSTHCVGSVAVQCSSPPGALDCGAAGLVCGQGPNPDCGTAPCTGTSTQCNGDFLLTCEPFAQVFQSTNCKYETPRTCGPGPGCTTQVADTCAVVGGKAQCVGTGPACDEATTPTKCDGTSIVSCTAGKLARLDCGSFALPLTCKGSSDGSFACAGTGTECDHTTPETCADGVITFCYLGTKTTANCKSLGFSGCKTTTASPTTAYCTP